MFLIPLLERHRFSPLSLSLLSLSLTHTHTYLFRCTKSYTRFFTAPMTNISLNQSFISFLRSWLKVISLLTLSFTKQESLLNCPQTRKVFSKINALNLEVMTRGQIVAYTFTDKKREPSQLPLNLESLLQDQYLKPARTSLIHNNVY